MQFQFSFQSESANSTGYSGKKPRRNSLNFNSLPVFKFGRNDSSAPKLDAGDPASIEDSHSQEDSERSGKRLKSTSGLKEPFEPRNKREISEINKADTSFYMNDFEREMNAALGLSPTETYVQQPQHPAVVEPAQPTQPSEPIVESIETSKQTEDLRPPSREGSALSTDAAEANMYLTSLPLADISGLEKDLPAPPAERMDDSASSDAADPPSRSGAEASHTTIPSIRAISEEDTKPETPPKDLPLPEAEMKDLPPVPPKDSSSNSDLEEQEHQEPRGKLALPQSNHAPRQPSVSTLGDQGQARTRASEEEIDTPPSPIHAAPEDTNDLQPSEETIYGKAIPPTNTSETSMPPVESAFPGFTPHPRPQSSQEILESKRRSISGLPPSAPGVQSPLRNEVRYSLGTRSSMLSFGSFGRQSTGNNSRGTRPNTPGNDLSQQDSFGSPANGDSKMDKLKSFGRRRRASVGNILTGIQGELQGIQEKSQKKRGFSRISGLFSRQQEPQQPATASKPEQRRKTLQDPLDVNNFTTPHSWNGHRSSEPKGQSVTNRTSMEKALPMPPAENGNGTARSSYDNPRASISGPPGNGMGGSRFYSQLMSGEAQPTQHTRSQSQPLVMSHPLSPVAPSESEKSSSASQDELEKSLEFESAPLVPSKSPVIEQEVKREDEFAKGQEQSQAQLPPSEPEQSHIHQHEQDKASQPILAPSLSVQSRKSTGSNHETEFTSESTKVTENNGPKNIVVSGTSTTFAHPHREPEPRNVTEGSEPVELALTRDDSSEEIVMSPTAYPGQEWTPMHY